VSAVVAPRLPSARRTAALALTVIVAFALSVALTRGLEAGHLALRAGVIDEAPYLAPEATRRLAAGFGGLVADWYWLTTLQYVGRKIEETQGGRPRDGQMVIELDRIEAVKPQVLVPLIELITTLDPRFTAVYEFAAVVLPAVDVGAAVSLLEKGIQANPDQWYLHQQLAYIYWQRGDHLAAAEAFRRGARMTTAAWMVHMAEKMELKGDDPQVARAMYTRMYEQAQDEQVKQWALKRLMELRSLQEREAIRTVLNAYVAANRRCPRAWTDVGTELQAAGLTVAPQGLPLDPSGAPYLLVVSPLGCDVGLHRASAVPRR
jgi:tetratricopeptide (TPR) repeat protein